MHTYLAKLRTQIQVCSLLFLLMIGVQTTQAQPRIVRSYLEKLQTQTQPLTPAIQHQTTALFIAGVCDLIVDKPEEALKHLQQALQLAPCNAAIHFKLAHLLQQYPQLATGTTTTALTHLYTAMTLAPNNHFYYLGTVMMHVDQGAYFEATQVYQQMFQHIPPTESLLLHCAGLYIAQKNYRKAIRVYDQLEQRLGITPSLTQYKKHLYLGLNDLEGALAEAIKLTKAYPQTETYILELTHLLSSNNQAQRAIPYLEADIALNPGHAQARIVLVQLLLEKREHTQAFAHFSSILATTSVPLQAKLRLFRTYLKQLPSKVTLANHQTLTQAFCLSYPQAQVYSICGDLYFALHCSDQALSYYLKALALDSTSYALWQRIIALYATQQHIDKVQELTKQALKKFPHQAALYYYQALAYIAQKQYPYAAEALEKGRELAVESTMLQLLTGYLGDVYYALEQHDQAEACYEAVLQKDPLNYHALNNYCYCLAQRQKKLLLAKRLAKKLIKQYPKEATYLDTYAWVLYQLGHYKQARKHLKRAISLGGNQVSGEIFAHYGAVLNQLGKYQAAQVQYKHAKALGYKEVSATIPKSEQHE